MELLDSFQPHTYKAGEPIAPPRTRWIWNIFWILLGITSVEVGLALSNYAYDLGWDKPLKFIYIFLTIAKAYYIIFSYMHLKDERKSFKLTLGFLVIILAYFVTLMMIEGSYQDHLRLILPEFFNGVGPDSHAGGEAPGGH